jgi:hypothetical protein
MLAFVVVLIAANVVHGFVVSTCERHEPPKRCRVLGRKEGPRVSDNAGGRNRKVTPMPKRVADKKSTATPAPEPRRGFLGATPQMLALASIDDRIYAELDRESRELQTETLQPASGRAKKSTAAAALNGNDWIDQYDSPLGKRKHMKLCREAVFPSGHKIGKQWLVRRAEIDAYIVQNGKSAKTADGSDIDRELAALGMGED